MAIVKKNIVTQGLSGTLGDTIVFRQSRGRTIVSVTPNQNNTPTTKQKAHRERFQLAVMYAKGQISDPVAKAEYEAAMKEESMSSYALAVTDFMKAPEIEFIDAARYTGKLGDTLLIRAVDDFKVKSVTVTISNADGTLVEKGNAVQQPNQLDWLYTATKANAAIAGDKITVTATDKPGNVTLKERVL
jgi:hypothetical protein